MSSQTKIEIFGFEDPAQFLRAVIDERRTRKNSNSLRQLAMKAGFRSAATLSMLVNRKRQLTLSAAEKIASALGLTGRRRKYFLAMARFDCSKTESDRNRSRHEMINLRSAVDEREIESKQYQFLAKWYFTTLYVLIGNSDFNPDPKVLRERLQNRVEIHEIEQALQVLCDLELIRKTEAGYEQTNKALTTKDDIRNTAVYLYHKKMNELAGEALDLPLAEREFNGITISVSKNRLPVVKEKVRQFRKDLNEYLSQFSETGEAYQMNFQIFPLTKSSKKEIEA